MPRAILSEPKVVSCEFCGKVFETVCKKPVKYCGRACSQNSHKRKRSSNIPSRMQELITGSHYRAKTKGVPHNIDKEYLLSLWEENDGCCSITKQPFDLTYGEKLQKGWSKKNAPSLDRIVPERGYVKGNVRLVAFQVNCAMGVYSDEDFYEMCRLALENKI